MIDPAIKYGGGEPAVRAVLTRASQQIAEMELAERRLLDLSQHLLDDELSKEDDELSKEVDELSKGMVFLKEQIAEYLRNAIRDIEAVRQKR